MANERVSQLNELLANELQTNDLFLITHVSQKESMKMELSQLILFLQSSASFNAIHAIYSDSASYVPGSGVDGIVRSASYAVYADTVGHALNAGHAISASYADKAHQSDSASWAPFTMNATASYALKAGYSDNAGVAYFLFYNGQPNGTASWAMNASYALTTGHVTNADTSSYLLYQGFPNGTASYALSSSNVLTASYALTPANWLKAFGEVTWSNSILSPVCRVQGNIASITYLGQFTGAADAPTYTHAYTCSNLGVTFQTALPNTNYTVIGNVSQPYDFTERGLVAFSNKYSNRTTTGFTMSLVTYFDDDYFTNITNADYRLSEVTHMVFMVLGL